MADASLVASVAAAAVSAGIETTTEAVAFTLGFATAMNAPRLSTAPFTLYYHETFSGRAQPTMMMLADAGVEYERKTAVRVPARCCLEVVGGLDCCKVPASGGAFAALVVSDVREPITRRSGRLPTW
jgi:hypothetical protein